MEELRILVCGDRNWVDGSLVRYIIWKLHEKTKAKQVTIIEGEAKGADTFAKYAAEAFEYNVLAFPAEWNKYGKSAGPIRNGQQLREGDPHVVVGFHDKIEESRGTVDMLNRSVKAEKPTILVQHDPAPDKTFAWRWWGHENEEFAL